MGFYILQTLRSHTTLPCSPKFFRKITYVPTLSDLARQVPITQIDITPAAYQWVILCRRSHPTTNSGQGEPQIRETDQATSASASELVRCPPRRTYGL